MTVAWFALEALAKVAQCQKRPWLRNTDTEYQSRRVTRESSRQIPNASEKGSQGEPSMRQASICSGALTALARVSPSGPRPAYLCGRV